MENNLKKKPVDKKMENNVVDKLADHQEDKEGLDRTVLCCGLVCLDLVTVVDTFPAGRNLSHATLVHFFVSD
jgi:hypothetical protein